VIVTGALSGIGRAVAESFARQGDHVVTASRRPAAGAQVVGDLRAPGAEAEFVLTGVRFEVHVEQLISTTIERFGRLDVAVNVAGTEGRPAPITDVTADDYATSFDTNVLGTPSLVHQTRDAGHDQPGRGEHRQHLLDDG
jgi:NAD(P)-dependent dehydrogenase (short-subunit alcohol dehydrogenase family)